MAEKKTALPSTPINYEAEQALLGSIMMDTAVSNEYTSLLREHDFAMTQNAVIFKTIFALNQENLPIDALTVADRLTLNKQLENAGGMEYISKLVTSIPSTANAQQYFDIVKRDSLRRDIIEAGNAISRAGYESESGKTALDIAERTVFKISEEHESSRLKPILEASTAAYNKIKSIQRGEYIDTGIKSGFKNLDGIIGSLPQGALCIIAARPSVGKTAFALSLSVNAALSQNKTVAIFSLEMPAIQLVQRMLTTLSGVPFSAQYTQSKNEHKR
jgi:Replicative DNA helicase